MTAPNMVLPIMVLNTLGAEQAAYCYIAYAIATLLFMIPSAISMSLFVEGSPFGQSVMQLLVDLTNHTNVRDVACHQPTLLLYFSVSTKSLVVIFSLMVPRLGP